MIRPYSRAFAMITASMYFMILAGCGGGDSGPTSPTPSTPDPPAPPPTPVATSITVAPASYTLASVGATIQLTATVRDQNNNPMTGQTVNWTSANTAVATVSGTGMVTAVSNGTSQITARSGNASGTASITVAEPVPTRIAVTPSSHTLAEIGATVQLTATVRDQRNNVMAGQTIFWLSGDVAVVTVDANGLVTAVGNGMAEITARSGSLSDTASITVASPVATSLTIEPASYTLEMIGATVQLAAVVRDQHDNVMTDATVTWSSGDESVATVSDQGLVTAVGNGMAEISAQAGDAMGTAAITASEPVATSITIEPTAHTLEAVGATVQLTATVLDQHENVMEDAAITWSSDDEAVATVDDAGLVTAVGNGMADITAKSGSLSSNAAITVSQAPAAIAIAVDPDSTTLTEIDQTLQLTAMVSDAKDAAIEDAAVSWSSSDESVATVDGDGLVTAVGNGMADITATAGEASGMVSISVMAPSPDRETLIAIYNATNGPNWTRQDNWLSEAPISTWYGISTDDGNRVIKLELSENGMTGSLPAELGQLAHLDSLTITSNYFLTEPIPAELAQLERLEYLNLGDNDLKGPIPAELARLERLEYLNLGGNDLKGPIPAELAQLERLEHLNLDNNDLTGPIPAELARLTSLKDVSLVNNRLSGPIPPELGQMASLKMLALFLNELSGTIPPELGQLTNLRQLELSGNNLSGNISPEFGQLANLEVLDLADNELSGSLPVELGQLQRLAFLKLENNADLSGSLPDSFLDLESLRHLGLNGTQICVPPDAEFQAWLAGVDDAQGISTCEVDDGDDGEVTYVPWTGVRVDKGKLEFSASLGTIDLTDCFTKNVLIGAVAPFPPEGLKNWNAPTGETLTVHYSLWQRSDDMGSTWTDIEATRVEYDACPYDPDVAGEYRLVGDITIDDDRSFRRSENTFVVP